MKTIELVKSPVVFHAEDHTYTLGEKSLSGITTIIGKYIFPDLYKDVSESVLEKARERGTTVHQLLEYVLSSDAESNEPEVVAVKKLFSDNKLTLVESEYLVSDNENVASSIDAVVSLENGIGLIDYKTTQTLNYEYLQWQLTIYAMLFEKQNNIKVDKLFAVHIPKVKDGVCNASLVEIEPLNYEYAESLIFAYSISADVFDNPLHKMSSEILELVNAYKEAEAELSKLQESIDKYETIKKDATESIRALMEQSNQTLIEDADNGITISKAKDSVRRTFSVDTLKSNVPDFPQEWMSAIESFGYKETTTKGRITIKIK